jgi:hypothetical protein
MAVQARSSRAEWEKRVERWKDSGLSAEQFAAEIGVNAGTLRQWKYSFVAKGRAVRAAGSNFVEVKPAAAVEGSSSTAPFELEVGRRRLRIPPQFDADALCRLIAVLERA